MQNNIIYVQHPADKTELLKLLQNVPKEILGLNYEAILWLDRLKRVAENIKTNDKN